MDDVPTDNVKQAMPLDRAKSLLGRLRCQDTGSRVLLWQVQDHWDPQGLSDRRARLAIILAEALLLDRALVLPRFTLSAQHNRGAGAVVSDLQKYISLASIPVPLLTRTDDVSDADLDEAVEVLGAADPRRWRRCPKRLMVRWAAGRGFWKSEVHASVLTLAAELHGTGMACTSGLFGPSFLVSSVASAAIGRLGSYVGLHVRRGDKLRMMPGLEEATSPENVLSFLRKVAPDHLRNVYLATDEADTSGYHKALNSAGFACHGRQWLQSLVTPEQGEDLARDNFLCFAVEMNIVDDATLCVRSFNDAMPWFTRCERGSAKVSTASYHLLDRSMHDYILGSSSLGTVCSPEPCSPIDLWRMDADALYEAIMSGELPRLPCSPLLSEANDSPPTILAFENRGPSHCSFTSQWPMRLSPETAEFEAELEILGPLGPVTSAAGVMTWTTYFGPLASFEDEVGGLLRRSTLYGFETLSKRGDPHPAAEIPRGTGAVFVYVSLGRVMLVDQHGTMELRAGHYGVTKAPVSFQLADATRMVAIHSEPFTPLRSFGGPIEAKGRLRYVDGCSDTLLLPPPKLADPCLNLLHFPPGIRQTAHTHPSVRCGLVASGEGYCLDGGSRQLQLQPGTVWVIHKGVQHSFHTTWKELKVIAYHPETDWGPMDENHPMLNRTLVDGSKIDNRLAAHMRADVLQTEQSFIEKWQHRQMEGTFGLAIVQPQSQLEVLTVDAGPGKYLVKYTRNGSPVLSVHPLGKKITASPAV